MRKLSDETDFFLSFFIRIKGQFNIVSDKITLTRKRGREKYHEDSSQANEEADEPQ